MDLLFLPSPAVAVDSRCVTVTKDSLLLPAPAVKSRPVSVESILLPAPAVAVQSLSLSLWNLSCSQLQLKLLLVSRAVTAAVDLLLPAPSCNVDSVDC